MSKFIFLLFAYMTLAGCSIGSLANKKTPYIYKNPYHYGVLNKNILMNHEGYTWFLNQYDKNLSAKKPYNLFSYPDSFSKPNSFSHRANHGKIVS